MELRAAESKSLMRRRTVKVGRGAGVTHAFLSSFPPFSDLFVPILFFKELFIKKKKLRHLLILADARSHVFDSVASKQSVAFSL